MAEYSSLGPPAWASQAMPYDELLRQFLASRIGTGELRGTGPGESRDPRGIATSGFAGALEPSIAQGVFDGSPMSYPIAAGIAGAYARKGYDTLSGQNGDMNLAGADGAGLAAGIAALATKNPRAATVLGGGAIGGLAGAGVGASEDLNPYLTGAAGAVMGAIPGGLSPTLEEARRLGTQYTDDVSRGLAATGEEFKGAPGNAPSGVMTNYRPERTDYWGDAEIWSPDHDFIAKKVWDPIDKAGALINAPKENYFASRKALLEAEINPGVRAVPGFQGFPDKDTEVLLRKAVSEKALDGRVSPTTLYLLKSFGAIQRDARDIPDNLSSTLLPYRFPWTP